MKRLNKRIISLLLALVMLCGMMPMTALATEGTQENNPTLLIPRTVKSMGTGVFSGRQNVNLTAYPGSAATETKDQGVELTLKKRFQLLVIGNSYSEDASSCGQGMTESQLLNILQAMLGEDTEVTVALLSSGGKGMHWHATQAEQGNATYSFRIISTENPTWKSLGAYTSADALAWTDWDVVSLQPYNINVSTGQESVPYPDATDPKFYHIEDSSAYMLDHVARYAPYADIYFYMHWAQTSSTVLNAALSNYNKAAAFMPQVLDFAGTESGVQFKDIIPVGLSIQNARTTYLALLRYNTTAYADGNLNLITDAQIGLQRDGGHVSFNIGRYIAGLTFAEMIVPNEMRADDYILPEIRVTESVGKLPKEYSEIAQKAVHAAVESWRNGSLTVTNIDGYAEDPTVAAMKILESMDLNLNCGDTTSIVGQIRNTVLSAVPADFAVETVVLDADQGVATVTIRFGYTSATVDLAYSSDHTYENGTCTGCGAEDPTPVQPLSMRYDDHLDMSGKTVEIIDAGTPTSYQVGYGVEENTVPDTAVVTLDGETLVATGIGTAKVKIDGILYEVTVEAAPISLLLLIGQSNMEGNEGEAKQSIVCPDGMVYATYGDRYDMVLENATHYAPSALTGEYRTVNTVGGTDGLSDYPVYMLTDEGDGRKGPDSGFAYEWVKQTGEKVWIVNAAHGGTSLDVWLPGTTQYEECQAMFGACQETLRKEIAAGHFTLSHMAYFWCQGCNDYNKTAEWYVKKYLSMHESLNAEMAFDHDSDAATPAKQFELAGIIPVRAGHSWSNGYRAGTHTDSTNKSSYESFVDLQMTGPRVAQYWMCNNPELEDIVLVCNIGEDWVWMPDGTNGVSSYFNTHYPNGTVNYTTQVQQSASWYKPTTPNAVHDSIHYNQIGYNEVGRESVRNALIYLGINPDYEEETTVKFVDWTGYKEVSAIEAATAGSSGTLVVPIVSPVTRSKTVSYTTSSGLSYKYYDLLADSVNMLGQLHAVGTVNSVTVTPRSLDSYTWNFNGTNLVSDPSEGDMDNSLTLLGGSITDGLFNGIRYKISRSICLNHDSEWGIELKISDWSATTGSMIFSDGSATTTGQPYVYFRPTDFFVGFGYYDGTQYNNYGVSLKNYGIACNEGTHTYCFVNRIAADGTNAIWLYVDGAEIAPLTEYYVNSTLSDANSNGLSGKDFVLSYIGTSDFAIKGCVINGIRVVETGYDPGIHLHTWSEWETESRPSSKGPGIEQRTCAECGKTQNREVEGVWQKYDLDDHMVDLPEVFCAETNLWSLLPHDKEYYHSGVRWDVNGNVHSVTFAVIGGEHIFATAFGKRGTNGTSSSDGIRLTFFGENGVLKTTSPQETYAEFVTNGGYIIVPKGAVAVNIPMYSNSDDNEIYILNSDHCYENGICTGCGEAQPGPVITQQPESVQQEIGKKFAITVKAEGEGLTYQWYVKEAGAKAFKLSVNKTSSYAYTMQSYMHNRQVYCVVTDANGNFVQTETATITRPPQALKILQQPKDVEAELGELFSIRPKVQGDGLKYQWYYKESYMQDFKPSSNKTAAYAYSMQAYRNGRQVYCVITDQYGNSVTTDVVTISLPPVELKLLEQPTDAYAVLGEKFSIKPTVQGDGLKYQWYVKEAGAKAFKVSSNKTSAYAYSMQSYMNGRQVYCVITDKYGNQVVTEVVTIHLEK